MKDNNNYYLKNTSNTPFSLQISNIFPMGAFCLKGFYSPQTTWYTPPTKFHSGYASAAVDTTNIT